jgi:hypothetical protein
MHYYVIMCVYVLFSAYASAFRFCRLFHIYCTKMKYRKKIFFLKLIFYFPSWFCGLELEILHTMEVSKLFLEKNFLSYSSHNFWKPMANPAVP